MSSENLIRPRKIGLHDDQAATSETLNLRREQADARKALADARASSEQLALAALAFVAALAFFVGRRYLRR